MYLCLDCGQLFEKPEKYTEYHGLDHPPYEVLSGCPACGGAYVETFQCDACLEYITDDYVHTADGRIYCENCYSINNVEDI